ncbi:MAG: 4Fe-4S dicluster domain-containing protein [Asgard group archaeon]|nr:4Fe-4S dicluster domain-containing protein [Asgard group archaeon]
MISKILKESDLPSLVDSMIKDYVVLATTNQDDVPTITQINDHSEVIYSEQLPMIPPKKIFLPANQTVFRYNIHKGITEDCNSIVESAYDKEVILFGVSPCDITGVNVLKRIFKDYYSDDAFLKLRENTMIIGMNCLEPCSENCFCESMGSNDPKTGYDIMLTKISDDKLIAVPNSDKGKGLLRQYDDIFQETTQEDFHKYNKTLKNKKDNFQKAILVEGLASQIEDSFESDVWQEYTDKCLFCGSCTFVCPTCYCYTTKDKVRIDLQDGERKREWDSCYYPEFALVAGPHNFRKEQKQRFRYRYLHKFVDLPRRYNFEGCVGCGRCITYCPADIDVREVLTKIRGEF